MHRGLIKCANFSTFGAFRYSKYHHTLFLCSTEPLQVAVKTLSQKISSSTFSVEVRRQFIIKDALKEAGKKKFDPFKTIKVCFSIYCTAITINTTYR